MSADLLRSQNIKRCSPDRFAHQDEYTTPTCYSLVLSLSNEVKGGAGVIDCIYLFYVFITKQVIVRPSTMGCVQCCHSDQRYSFTGRAGEEEVGGEWRARGRHVVRYLESILKHSSA